MNLAELVDAAVERDALRVREWLVEADRFGFDWSSVALPATNDPLRLAVAAGIVEVMAERAGLAPPPWTAQIGPAPVEFSLVAAAEVMPRLRMLCLREGPRALRDRRLLAPPDYLTAA